MMVKERNIDGGYAWLVLVASFSVMMVLGMLVYSTGVFNTAVLEEVDGELARTSWVGSTQLGTFTLCGPLAGLVTKACGYRPSCFIGGVLMLLGLASASFVNDVTGLILTYGLLAGVGMGLAFNAASVVTGHYFRRKRGIAFGVSLSGAGLGMFCGGPLVQMLLQAYNLRGTLLIFGAICFNVCVAASLLRPVSNGGALNNELEIPDGYNHVPDRRKNENHVDQHGGKVYPSFDKDKGNKGVINEIENKEEFKTKNRNIKPETDPENMELLVKSDTENIHNQGQALEKDHKTNRCIDRVCNGKLMKQMSSFLTAKSFNKSSFFMYCLSMLFWAMGDSACLFHLPNYALSKGSSKTQSASLFTVMGVANLSARILAGFAGNDNTIGFLLLHVGLLGMAGLLTLSFPLFSHTYGLQLAFSVVFGVYNGGPNAGINPLSIELVGLERLPVASGMAYFFCGLGFLIGPPLASFMFKLSGRYDTTFVFAGSILLISALFGCFVALFTKSNKTTQDTENEIMISVDNVK